MAVPKLGSTGAGCPLCREHRGTPPWTTGPGAACSIECRPDIGENSNQEIPQQQTGHVYPISSHHTTTLPSCTTEPSSRSCNAAPRALAPEAPGYLPRVVRSGSWQTVQKRPEALSTNVCPRRWMAGSSGNGRGQDRARSRRLAIARPDPRIQVASMSPRSLAGPVRAICGAMQVTAKLAECLAAQGYLAGAPEPPACQPHQPSHSQPGHQQRSHKPAPLQEWCAS